MDTQIAAMEPDAAVPLPPAETPLPIPPSREVTDEEFAEVVRGALEAVGGTLLFKARIGAEEKTQLVAAASVGAGAARQFLLLSLPTSGGQLKVEMAARSSNPLAGIAASYAGLMDAFRAAA
jgi:hypothetical protein